MDFYLNKSFTISTFAKKPKISLIGIPFDSTATEFPGQRFGPQKIRETLNHIYTVDAKTDVCLFEHFEDLGNINVVHGDVKKTMLNIELFLEKFFEQRKTTPIFLGGEHTITYGIISGLAKKYNKIDLVVFDAHLDCCDSFAGEELGHLSYLNKLISEKKVENVFVIGAREYSKFELDFAKKHKIKIITVEDSKKIKIKTKNPTYVSFDLDVLDFTIAVGTGTPELGGLETKIAIDCLKRVIGQNKVIGLDIVELNPMVPDARTSEYAAAYVLRASLFGLLTKS